ncbi:hypothetical protein H0H93_010973 [Arthromyces matolae]|nr:hypothetical protein H0H93_010973 [Arthromyces matolae]
MDTIAALKAKIQRDIAKENTKRPQHRSIATTNTAMVNRSRLPGNIMKSTAPGPRPTSAQVKVEEGFGEPGPSSNSSVRFRGPAKDALSRKSRSSLDDRIEEFSEIVREHYGVVELGDPTSSSDDDITVIGRIVTDSETADGTLSKLAESSVSLEASRANGGSRIALRFDPALTIRGGPQGAGGLGLFPGSIVALKGKNGGGGWFLVKEILSLPPLKPSSSSIKSEIKADPENESAPFSMYVACGPYTPDADLSYKPWRALVKTLEAAKPAVTLLLGPFIDVQHPKIKTGDIDIPPADLFRSLIIKPLKAYLDANPGSIAILVPSVRDIISTQAVYPQGELGVEYTASDPRIHLLPNPACFSINDITFGVNSVDVVYHLRKGELQIRGKEIDSIPDNYGADAMANTCRHLLQQRSFYPLFPVPFDVSHEVNLSVSHLDGLGLSEDNNSAPDVLILPSRLKQFSKLVHATTAINPSFLSKGTFAKIIVNPSGDVASMERINVEIAKLDA